jgi:hypothetical protein
MQESHLATFRRPDFHFVDSTERFPVPHRRASRCAVYAFPSSRECEGHRVNGEIAASIEPIISPSVLVHFSQSFTSANLSQLSSCVPAGLREYLDSGQLWGTFIINFFLLTDYQQFGFMGRDGNMFRRFLRPRHEIQHQFFMFMNGQWGIFLWRPIMLLFPRNRDTALRMRPRSDPRVRETSRPSSEHLRGMASPALRSLINSPGIRYLFQDMSDWSIKELVMESHPHPFANYDGFSECEAPIRIFFRNISGFLYYECFHRRYETFDIDFSRFFYSQSDPQLRKVAAANRDLIRLYGKTVWMSIEKHAPLEPRSSKNGDNQAKEFLHHPHPTWIDSTAQANWTRKVGDRILAIMCLITPFLEDILELKPPRGVTGTHKEEWMPRPVST